MSGMQACRPRSRQESVVQTFAEPGALVFRNDEVERLADCLAGAMAENPDRPWAPERDRAVAIGGNDRVRG